MVASPVVVPQVEPEVLERRAPEWQRRLVVTLVSLDVLAAGIAGLLALIVRFGEEATYLYEITTALFPLVWIAACASTRSYEPRFLGAGTEEPRRVLDAGLRLLALTALLSFALKLEVARLYVLLVLPAAVILSLLSRHTVRQWLRRQREAGACVHRVVVVGRERSCAELVRQLRSSPQAGFLVVGACIDRPRARQVEGVPVVGTSQSVVQALRHTQADTVAVGAWSDLTQDDLRRLSWQLEGSGVDLVVAPSLTDIAGPRIHIRPVAGLPLLHVDEPELTGGRRLLKGTVDRTLALLALVVLFPVLVVLALAVRLSSPGPAFFKQVRIGVRGRSFKMLKLRSMHVDAEDNREQLLARNERADGLLFKIRDDPRVTPLGRVLRRFSLDELPQLVNVVTGSMSLVGPRPPLPSEVERYGADVRRRLLVKPGLTGLWQVSGRSDLSWDESVRLDLHYVENWTLALDVAIILRTVAVVLRRQGAY